MECNRRLGEPARRGSDFLGRKREATLSWVERSETAQKSLTLNAAPGQCGRVSAPAAFRERRPRSSSTSATLATKVGAGAAPVRPPRRSRRRRSNCPRPSRPWAKKGCRRGAPALLYLPPPRRVGAEAATLLQVGTPFDYERQMKLYVARKMPDPRKEGYRDALIHWMSIFS